MPGATCAMYSSCLGWPGPARLRLSSHMRSRPKYGFQVVSAAAGALTAAAASAVSTALASLVAPIALALFCFMVIALAVTVVVLTELAGVRLVEDATDFFAAIEQTHRFEYHRLRGRLRAHHQHDLVDHSGQHLRLIGGEER